MASFAVAPSSVFLAKGTQSVPSICRSKVAIPSQRRARRSPTQASLADTGYTLADAVSKVADKADRAVGSVNAPGWVLPVSAIAVAVILTASSLLLKPGVDAQEQMAERDSKKWNKRN